MKKTLTILLIIFSAVSSYAYQYGTVTATGSATLVLAASRSRAGVMICNTSTSVILYIGLDSSVTTSNGTPIQAASCYSASAPQEVWKGTLYAIAGSGSIDTRYQEYGLGDLQ